MKRINEMKKFMQSQKRFFREKISGQCKIIFYENEDEEEEIIRTKNLLTLKL